MKIAVIGAGLHSTTCHGPALQELAQTDGEIELTAICDLTLAKATQYAERFGFGRAYDNVDAMLAQERIDGLLVITNVSQTENLILRVFERRIPILLEKPPGFDSATTRRLLTAADQHRAPHMISFNRRFMPPVQKARAWLAASGNERPPALILARMLRYRRHEPEFMVGTGIHAIDAVISFLGNPRQTTTVKHPAEPPSIRLFNARLQFGEGSEAVILITPAVGYVAETYEILGRDYCIHIDACKCELTIHEHDQTVLEWTPPANASAAFKDGTVGETAAFIQAVAAGGGFHPDLRQGLVSVLTAEAIEAGGETIFPAPVDSGTEQSVSPPSSAHTK